MSKSPKTNSPFILDAENFTPLNYIDKDFDIDVIGEEIFGEYNPALHNVTPETNTETIVVEDNSKIKLGKVLGNQYNSGIALIDINKLDLVGTNA